MRAGAKWSLFQTLALVAVTACPGAAAEMVVLTPEARTNFEWFSKLGFPDVKGCPLVQVATGGWYQNADEAPQNTYTWGFLISTNLPSFRVFTPSLADWTLVQTNAGAMGHGRVGFELLSFTDEVAKMLRVLQDPPTKDPSWREYGTRREVFTMAWACWRNGMESEAQQLYQRAVKMPTGRGNDKPAADFGETLEKNLA